jgi:hypothetical protein
VIEVVDAALMPVWFVVVLVACIAATVCVTVPLTVKFCDRRRPVHPAVTFDPSYVRHLAAARAQADEYLQELRAERLSVERLKAQHELQLRAAWEWSEKLRQRALRAARSNRRARAVLRELTGWGAREVRYWGREWGVA